MTLRTLQDQQIWLQENLEDINLKIVKGDGDIVFLRGMKYAFEKIATALGLKSEVKVTVE
jgi:hypothetical protein